MFESYSFVDMFGPIHGSGWYSPEVQDGRTFRWSKADSTSHIKIPLFNTTKLDIRFLISFIPQEHQLENLKLDIDGINFDFAWSFLGPYCSVWGTLITPQQKNSAILRISVPEVIHSPSSPDKRSLGLAINAIEIVARDGASHETSGMDMREPSKSDTMRQAPEMDMRETLEQPIFKKLARRYLHGQFGSRRM